MKASRSWRESIHQGFPRNIFSMRSVTEGTKRLQAVVGHIVSVAKTLCGLSARSWNLCCEEPCDMETMSRKQDPKGSNNHRLYLKVSAPFEVSVPVLV